MHSLLIFTAMTATSGLFGGGGCQSGQCGRPAYGYFHAAAPVCATGSCQPSTYVVSGSHQGYAAAAPAPAPAPAPQAPAQVTPAPTAPPAPAPTAPPAPQAPQTRVIPAAPMAPQAAYAYRRPFFRLFGVR